MKDNGKEGLKQPIIVVLRYLLKQMILNRHYKHLEFNSWSRRRLIQNLNRQGNDRLRFERRRQNQLPRISLTIKCLSSFKRQNSFNILCNARSAQLMALYVTLLTKSSLKKTQPSYYSQMKLYRLKVNRNNYLCR